MAKEDLRKDIIKKPRALSRDELQQALIENFINLQKVMANFASKFDELSTNISKLLQLFEISAKTFAEKYSSIDEAGKKSEIDPEFIKKLDTLLDQNRIISKGIMLIEEKLREKNDSLAQQSMPPSMRKEPDNRYPPNIKPAPRY